MKLIKGKFYNEGEVVPLEHGNKDQIQLLEKAAALKDGGIMWFTSDFHCLCGHVLQPKPESVFKCLCGQRYKATTDEDEIPIIKFS